MPINFNFLKYNFCHVSLAHTGSHPHPSMWLALNSTVQERWQAGEKQVKVPKKVLRWFLKLILKEHWKNTDHSASKKLMNHLLKTVIPKCKTDIRKEWQILDIAINPLLSILPTTALIQATIISPLKCYNHLFLTQVLSFSNLFSIQEPVILSQCNSDNLTAWLKHFWLVSTASQNILHFKCLMVMVFIWSAYMAI